MRDNLYRSRKINRWHCQSGCHISINQQELQQITTQLVNLLRQTPSLLEPVQSMQSSLHASWTDGVVTPDVVYETDRDTLLRRMDEGITGTSVKKRNGFLKMIQQCKAGKIDLIITKTISRFSRNTLNSISYVRMLKQMGIGVFFEDTGINTLETQSELLFTMLSAIAQAESESISGNIKFGKRESFRQGKVSYRYTNWYGFKCGEDNLPQIVPDEAQVVRHIFNSYLAGYSLKQIADELNEEQIPTRGSKGGWLARTIQDMLKNERYCGNILLQKTFVVDCISKQIKKNTGQLPQYLVQGCHEGIVTEHTYNLVQTLSPHRQPKRRA